MFAERKYNQLSTLNNCDWQDCDWQDATTSKWHPQPTMPVARSDFVINKRRWMRPQSTKSRWC